MPDRVSPSHRRILSRTLADVFDAVIPTGGRLLATPAPIRFCARAFDPDGIATLVSAGDLTPYAAEALASEACSAPCNFMLDLLVEAGTAATLRSIVCGHIEQLSRYGIALRIVD
jgi:hypothetical protein